MDIKTIMKQPIVWVAIGYDPDALLHPLHLFIFLCSLLACTNTKYILGHLPFEVDGLCNIVMLL